MQAHTFTASVAARRRDMAVESFRSRVVWLAFAQQLCAWLAGWLMVYGCVVLACRAFHLSEYALLWGLLGAVPAAFGAGACAWRTAPPRAAVVALLDDRSGAHGLMLLGEERGDLGAWDDRVASPAEIGLAWKPGRALAAVLLSAVFAVAAFFIPMPAAASVGSALDVETPVARLQAQVDALRDDKLLDEQAAAQLKERLNQLKAEAKGENPAKTWEALDHLGAEVQAVAAKGAEEMDKDARAADAALNLGAALDAHGGELSPDQVDAARAEQERREDKAFKEMTDGGLPGVKPPPGMQVPGDLMPKLTPEEREKMRQFIKENRAALQKMAQQMAQAGLGQEGRKMGLTPEQMEQLLQQIKDGKLPGGQGGGQMPGQGGEKDGGQKSGPGGFNQHSDSDDLSSAGITWQDPTTKEGAGFDPKTVDSTPDLRGSVKLGESSAAPTVGGKDATDSAGGGLAEGAGGGGSAARQNVLPRHRKAVDTYFERK